MQLINELRYDNNDFASLEIGDLIVVYKGNVTVLHLMELDEEEIGKIKSLLASLCQSFNQMGHEIFNEDGSLRELYSKNGYANIGYAVLQFSGFPNLIIGEVEENDNGWSLNIANDWYDVLNSKELQQLLATKLLGNHFETITVNGREYPISQLGNNKPKDIPLANPLFHGTIEKYLPSIMAKGIRKVQGNSAFNAANDGFVFLASDFNTAKEYADMYARKFGSNGAVLQVDSDKLDKNRVTLDYDFVYSFGKSKDKSPFTGNEIGTARLHHKGDFINVGGDYGTKYGKIGYKGTVMPDAIEQVTIFKKGGQTDTMTRKDFLNMAVKENKNRIDEWFYPEGFENLPERITLYHGTDYDGLEDILLDGTIDARSGRRTGETKGMNWFSTKYSTNFSRGFIFSIEISKDEINKTTDGFKYMNNNEIANYEPISIENRNFTILEAFGYNFDSLKNNMWKKCLAKTGGDLSEAVFLFIEKFGSFSNTSGYDISLANPVVEQLLKQLAGADNLKGEGLIESIQQINEVDGKDISLKSFETKDELNPKFWVNGKLNSRVRLRLLDIADDFIDTLATDWVKPKDVVLTGSLANYNWSKYSDIDVHVILDYKKVYEKTEFVEDYFASKKEMWLNDHPDLKIYGFPVEMYVEDSNGKSASTGIYSLYKNKWLKEPNDFQDAKLNEKYIKDYAAKVMTQIDGIEKKQKSTDDSHKTEAMRKQLKGIFDKVKKLRKESLKKSGEMSSGNIIFKILRRTGYIDKIWDLLNTSYDKINSIEEAYFRNTSTDARRYFDGQPTEPAEYGGKWVEVKPLDGWECIGTVKDQFGQYYMLADMDAPKDMNNFRDFIGKHISVNKEKDGSDGYQSLTQKIDSRNAVYDISNEYKGSYYDMLFNGITDEYRQWKRNDYLKRCLVVNGNAIAYHDSSEKITDGVVKPSSKRNSWSKAGDWGAYFWLSKNRGGDPSNGGKYTYYCQIPLDKIYFSSSTKLSNSDKADDSSILKEYPYIAGDWDSRNAVACQTYAATPIWCINTLENGQDKWYDKDWNEIQKPEILDGMK